MSKKSPASRLVTQAARDVLRPLGLKQRGSSQIWFDDHDWWLVVVEFQPSAWSQGSHLNVGAMWLWRSPAIIGFDSALTSSIRVRDHVDYRDDAQFTKAARGLAEAAADQVAAYRERFSALPTVAEHLESRLAGRPTIWDWYHAAVAAGLLGDVRRSHSRFEKVLDDPAGKGASPFPWAAELQEQARSLYEMDLPRARGRGRRPRALVPSPRQRDPHRPPTSPRLPADDQPQWIGATRP